MADPSSPLMLSVSGLRGIIGASLTPEVAARFAGAFGGWLREAAAANGAGTDGPTVVIGRDGRAGGLVIYHAVVAGLIGAGCRVVDLGIAMTPTVAVMTDWYLGESPAGGGGGAAGMVLTASHNPQEWNGLKCLVAEGKNEFGSAACAPAPGVAEQIIARFKEGRIGAADWSRVGQLVPDDAGVEEHVGRVCAALEAVTGMPADELGAGLPGGGAGGGGGVAVDSVNGSGTEGARVLLESLGCSEILQMGADDTGIFPHPPEPLAENLTGLCESVREMEAAVGFAQDPDADRLAIVDERGRYIGEEYTLVLAAMSLLETMKRRRQETRGLALVTNLSTSRMLDDAAAAHGAHVVRTPVGEANVVAAMKACGQECLLGGEGNGGIIWPRVTYVRDSLSAMGLVLALIQSRGQPLSTIVDGIPAYAIRKRKLAVAGRAQAQRAVDAVGAAFTNGGANVDRRDGAWVDLSARRAWLHVRPSNTEPIVRLIAEAPTAAEADSILAEAERTIAGPRA